VAPPRPSAVLQQRALSRAQPLSALLELTYACNWRCVFCYNPRHHDRRRLDGDEWAAVVDDLRQLGTLNVTLTGGEPLTHPQAFEVMAAVRARAMTFRLFTNGALVTQEVARRLAELRPVAVELSLHGARPETHDRTTATPGSFDALWRGVLALKSHGVPVILKTPLSRINEHELDEMVALTERAGIPYNLDATLTHRDDGDSGPLQFSMTTEGFARYYALLARRKQIPATHRTPGGVNCGLGRTTLAVDPEGNVYPCPQWRKASLGNVRETRLLQLWKSSTVRLEAAAVAREANDALLAAGGPMASFPFCPAVAQERTGDPVHADALHLADAEAAARARLQATTGT
jgi:MoaA/NifB/PqqE/SkfB family radical SAM enzyme